MTAAGRNPHRVHDRRIWQHVEAADGEHRDEGGEAGPFLPYRLVAIIARVKEASGFWGDESRFDTERDEGRDFGDQHILEVPARNGFAEIHPLQSYL